MKTIEEIRAGLGMSQKAFAEAIGLSLRAYCYRITGEREWTSRELIAIAKMNNGEVRIVTEEGTFDISIHEA